MQRVKRRIFSGVVCEQEVYTVSDRANIKKAEPRPRFKDDEERAQHRIGISKRKHQRLVNENFSPLSLYSTLTFDDDSEVHTFSEARRIPSSMRNSRSWNIPFRAGNGIASFGRTRTGTENLQS